MSTSKAKTDATIRRVLHKFNCAEPTRFERMSGGYVNSTWLVQSAHDERVVLQSTARVDLVPRLNMCARFARALRDNGVRCAVYKPISAESYVVLDDNLAWRALEWLPGKTPDATPSDQHFSALADFLPDYLSAANNTSVLLPQYEDMDFYGHNLISNMSRYKANVGFSEVERNLDCSIDAISKLYLDNSRNLASIISSRRACHGDLNIRNFLIDEHYKVRLIDFESCFRGPLWHDLGDVARSWASNKEPGRWVINTERLNSISKSWGVEVSDTYSATVATTAKLILHLVVDIFQKKHYAFNCHPSEFARGHALMVVRSQIELIRSLGFSI